MHRNFVPTSMSEDLVIFGHTRPAFMYHCQAVKNHIDTKKSSRAEATRSGVRSSNTQ